MRSYLIGYDLIDPGQNYDLLIKKIKELGKSCRCLDSTWIIKSNYSAVDIRNDLQNYIDKNDALIIIKLSDEATWTGLEPDCEKWLRTNL